MIPPGALPDGSARVMLAVVQGYTSHNDIMGRTGLSRAGVNAALRKLRTAGLVEWTDGQHGTIHAAAIVVTP